MSLMEEESDLSKGFLFKNRYRIVNELRSGGQARVFIVQDIHSHDEKRVIKMVDSDNHKDVKNEIDLLKALRNKSEYIIQYYDDFSFFRIKHCIVTEYCHNQDLAHELKLYQTENRKISDDKIDLWNSQIVEGLCFLHEMNIIHRDIKPQNIFVTERNNLKIGDLGFSINTEEFLSQSRIIGTLNYMSPEILKNETYDTKIDTWGYGCVLYEIIFLEKLFKKSNDFELQKQIIENDPIIPKTREIYTVIFKKCLEKNQIKRAYMTDIKKLIQSYQDKKPPESISKIEYETTIKYDKLISGSRDWTIKVWDVESGSCIKTLTGHTGSIVCLRILGFYNGIYKIISGSDDRTIKVWDVESGRCLKTLIGHSSAVVCIEVLDKNKIISGSFDSTIKFWDIEDGGCIKTLTGHSNWVRCLTLIDNKNFLSGSDDETIKMWDIESGYCIKTLKGHTQTVVCMEIFDKKKLVSGSYDKTIKIWDLESGECIKTLTGHSNTVVCMILIDKNKIISGSDDKTIKIWDAESGSCLKTLTGHTNSISGITQMDNDKIISGSFDKSIKLWNFKSGECEKTFTGHSNWIYCLSFTNKYKLNDKKIKSADSVNKFIKRNLSSNSFQVIE